MRFFRKESFKKVLVPLGLGVAYLLLFMTSACLEGEDTRNKEGCPIPTQADATGIKQVFFSPYKAQRYATALDTVLLSEFRFNFELEILIKKNQNSSTFPLHSEKFDCIQTFSLQNISNISVILTAPFAGLPIGTDISYLLFTPDKKRISELRDFGNVSVFFGTSLELKPPNYSQLKTRTFLFLKNGTQKFVDSTSPFLKTN
ncbi:MAG: hypothetical protein C0433_06505 [Cyclobacterium sp.]|nr:hypothetical protein [Cyclobacterium sp.]